MPLSIFDSLASTPLADDAPSYLHVWYITGDSFGGNFYFSDQLGWSFWLKQTYTVRIVENLLLVDYAYLSEAHKYFTAKAVEQLFLHAAQTNAVHLTFPLAQSFIFEANVIYVAPCHLTDYVELADNLSAMALYRARANELLDLTTFGSTSSLWLLSATQGLELKESTNVIASALSEELITILETVEAQSQRIANLLEALGLQGRFRSAVETTANVAEVLKLSEFLVFLFDLSLNEQLDIAATTQPSLLRTAYLEDTAQFAARFRGFISTALQLFSGITLQEAALFEFKYIFSAEELLQLDDATFAAFLYHSVAAELIHLHDGATFSFVVFARSQDTLRFYSSANATLWGLLTSHDSISFAPYVRLLEGDYQAWVLNTDSLGVSEYANFPFNSLAAHKGKYYGVTESGLFELTGDTDEGTPIEAVIRTGDMDFGTRQHKTLVRAYLYLTGTDDIILKTISTHRGIRSEAHYQVNARLTHDDGQTRRVRLGKGLRGTTWALELKNVDGGDFDLRYAEVLPVALFRRV